MKVKDLIEILRQYDPEDIVLNNCYSFVEYLSFSELNKLQEVVFVEKENQIKNKLKKKDFPALDDNEIGLIKSDNIMPAIKSYKDRNNCDLMFAKMVIYSFKDKKD